MRFLLYKDGAGKYLTYTDPADFAAKFPITSARREHSGNYTCRYSINTGPTDYSEPSIPVQIIVADAGLLPEERTFTTQTEVMLASTSEGSGPRTCRETSTDQPLGTGTARPPVPPVQPIIAGVGAGAAVLLLLLLVCLVSRCRKGPRQSRGSDATTTVYATLGQGMQLDVLPQEPDCSTERLTYAELDRQALQTQRGALAPAPEPTLYTTVSVSRRPQPEP
ncbi:uncharacterized protein LOC142024590 [Carettochelys insculpta]|uniref:uncharacterized protein LOC142024590 n=1 Tax=Carettochelys insculpta TaxID=44489 RepID=UPI003EBFCB07